MIHRVPGFDRRFVVRGAFAGVAIAAATATVRADEGMWLLNHPPLDQLKSKYRFEPSPQWMDHLQKSAVRFQTGGSGSVVSPDGLVMTNHHVGSDMLAKLSTPDHDLLKTGFYAKTRTEEAKCPDLELNILWSIDDVTDRIKAAAKPGMSSEQAGKAVREMISTVESEAQSKSGMKAEVVTLYGGGRYHLYLYRRYTDVRLVFAPEQAAAFFGGDTDNFEFPRYDLDVCFFRIYDNGQPLKAEHYLTWSKLGSKEGDLALVFGHPGRTERLKTIDELRFLRDVRVPASLRFLWRDEVKLQSFCGRNPENERIGSEELFGVANGRKAYTGQLAGLEDPALMAKKATAEDKIRAAAAKVGGSEGDDPWKRVASAMEEWTRMYPRFYALTRVVDSPLLKIGQDLVRLAEEMPKPSAERLREFSDAGLESTELALYSPAPIYDAFEIQRIESALSYLVENFGGDDPLVKKLLAGKSPMHRAEEIVGGTKLKDVEARKTLAKGGAKAIEASTDPLIAFERLIDPDARAFRKLFEDKVESVQRSAYQEIAATRFAAEGERVYPDATFTLRMAFGPIKGYQEGGQAIPAYTTFAGLYTHAAEHRGVQGFDIPESWLKAKSSLDLNTPFNFVCTADIIGGNSGSPVVNTRGEVIGLIFDGNIYSLPWAFEYGDTQGRAVAVDSRALIEAIRKVYGAAGLADELVSGNTATK